MCKKCAEAKVVKPVNRQLCILHNIIMFDYNIMPPKKDIKKKKKPLKQKQKQKQIVKQNVRVNVQSSGGSGAGGTSVPASSPIPFNYFDRTGENVQIRNLVEEAVRRQAIPRVVQLPADAPISQPANDATTFQAVFNAPQ